MYLNELSNEQKDLFMDLAIFTMKSNGVVEEQEENLVRQYCVEMNIDFRSENKCDSHFFVLKRLSELSTKSELRKITIEIIALMYADTELADEENDILKDLQDIFDFDSHLMGELVFSTRHLLLSLKMLENIVKI